MKNYVIFLAALLCVNGLYAHESSGGGTGISASEGQTSEAPHYHVISTKEMVDLTHSQKPIFILDARTVEYRNGKRIPGAKYVPYTATDQEIVDAIPSKSSYVVVYCSSQKCPASKYLADRLVNMGYSNVYKYPDGLDGWVKAGNGVEQD